MAKRWSLTAKNGHAKIIISKKGGGKYSKKHEKLKSLLLLKQHEKTPIRDRTATGYGKIAIIHPPCGNLNSP